MMPSASTDNRTSSPFVIERDDDSSLDNDLVLADDSIEADDPLSSTTDRTPLTGNIANDRGDSSRSGIGGSITGSYLTSSIPGEDRRAPVNTIDESVWDTLSRDLIGVWEKMRQVLWPKYLLGGMLNRGGGGIGGAAERGEATGFGNGLVGGVRGLVGRWPDADVVLQGGMSEGLRDWDLWGPLIFCLLLSMFMSMAASKEQKSLVFSGMFCIVWIGEAVVTLQIKLLGGNISFFQSVCLIGYTTFPLVIAALLSALGLPFIPRIPVYIVLIAWSLAAGISPTGRHNSSKRGIVDMATPEEQVQLERSKDPAKNSQISPTDEQENEAKSPRRDAEELSEGTKILESTTEPEETNEPTSDSKKDGSGERPVRQKLKETSIGGVPSQQQVLNNQPAEPREYDPEDDDKRGRVRRKRSFDEAIETDEADNEVKKEDDNAHRRKRSRSSKAEERPNQENQVKPVVEREPTLSNQRRLSNDTEEILSPKKKRSRDQLDREDRTQAERERQTKGNDLLEGSHDVEEPKPSAKIRTAEGEPEKKRHRDESRDRDSSKDDSSTKPCLSNPFLNTSATSPFAGLPAPAPVETSSKTQPTTSTSAFASSGLAAFAGSEKSPFGTIGSGPSIFGSMKPMQPTTKEKEKSQPPTTGASSFGSFSGGFSSSAFAKFAAPVAPTTTVGLTSFASPAAPAAPAGSGAFGGFGGNSKTKAFGATSDDEGGEEEQTEDETRPAFEGLEDVKEDERFFKQETETGEENERTWYSGRGKLFQFDGKEWKERGIGTFKINAMESLVEGEEGSKPKKVVRSARMIMRSDGVLRVTLNCPIFKGMKVGDANGSEPKGKQIHLAGIENGKSIPFLLRTSSTEAAKDIYHSIHEILADI
ncbi:hypothetical protein LOZ56_003321 [Ophidiomyces ophidiicola]|nr:hypothetical protein LOZ56_003321 [Ophidiomyces ophidiicola]KAI2119392.1 hypothetical protein LOZ32_003022 [Ophidiomyces ophidiicola]KAI2272565.1 hypothetical protein LOZ05_002249 [Ophidiomyces ophidiicola]